MKVTRRRRASVTRPLRGIAPRVRKGLAPPSAAAKAPGSRRSGGRGPAGGGGPVRGGGGGRRRRARRRDAGAPEDRSAPAAFSNHPTGAVAVRAGRGPFVSPLHTPVLRPLPRGHPRPRRVETEDLG